MAQEIIDGTGSGNRAKVTSANQLLIAGVLVPEVVHISSVSGDAFQFHSERVMTASNVFENVMHLTYNGEYQLQIDSIMFSREDVALSSSGQAVVEVMQGIEYTSGGASVTPLNMNDSSSNLSDCTLYSGVTTMVLDDSNEREILDIAINTSHNHDFKGALIMKKGDTLTVIGKSLNIGDIVHAIAFGYIVKNVI